MRSEFELESVVPIVLPKGVSALLQFATGVHPELGGGSWSQRMFAGRQERGSIGAPRDEATSAPFESNGHSSLRGRCRGSDALRVSRMRISACRV